MAEEGLYLVQLIQQVSVGAWVGGVVSLVVGVREGEIPRNVQVGDQQFAAVVSSACPSSAPVVYTGDNGIHSIMNRPSSHHTPYATDQ